MKIKIKKEKKKLNFKLNPRCFFKVLKKNKIKK